ALLEPSIESREGAGREARICTQSGRIRQNPRHKGGSMIVNATTAIEDLTLLVEQEIHVHASLEDTFAALLEQLGHGNEVGDGRAMPMVLEAWPGGRWYRDLGADN